MYYILNTLIPYKQLTHNGIQYTNCREFREISRYKSLRQVIHNPRSNEERFVALETPNAFIENQIDFMYYDVPASEENRLDIIAHRYLGAATYGWVIAYFNGLDDGYSVREGQRIRIPTSVTSLFNSGNLLAPVSALQLNLGEE